MGECGARERPIGFSAKLKIYGPWNLANLSVFGKRTLLNLSWVNKDLTYLRAIKVCLSPSEVQSVNFIVCMV